MCAEIHCFSKSQEEFTKGNTFITSAVFFRPTCVRLYALRVSSPLSVNFNDNNNNNTPVVSLSLSEADGVCDEQGVPGVPEVVSSGRLSSASASDRIRSSLCGELRVRPALSHPPKVLLQWLRTHLPSPRQSIQR